MIGYKREKARLEESQSIVRRKWAIRQLAANTVTALIQSTFRRAWKRSLLMQPRLQWTIPSINLVSNEIYPRIDGILLASSKFGQSYKEDLSQSETAKYFEWIIIATIGLTAIGIYILPNHKSFHLRRNCQKNSLYFGKQLHMYFASRYGLLRFFRLQCFKI